MNKLCVCHTALDGTKETEMKCTWPWNCLLAYVASRQTMRRKKAGICMKVPLLGYSDMIQWSIEHLAFKMFGIKIIRNATEYEHKETFSYSVRKPIDKVAMHNNLCFWGENIKCMRHISLIIQQKLQLTINSHLLKP